MTKKARTWLLAYVAVGVLTFLAQIWIRLPQCDSFAECALSLTKGVVWSAIWPVYWPIYLAGL